MRDKEGAEDPQEMRSNTLKNNVYLDDLGIVRITFVGFGYVPVVMIVKGSGTRELALSQLL